MSGIENKQSIGSASVQKLNGFFALDRTQLAALRQPQATRQDINNATDVLLLLKQKTAAGTPAMSAVLEALDTIGRAKPAVGAGIPGHDLRSRMALQIKRAP